MAARDGAASIQGDAIRITPLNADGSIDHTRPVLTTDGFISASFGTEFEDGDEITEKSANGAICIQYKSDDSLKGITFNLSLCSPDPEAAALLAGGKVICDPVSGEIVGYSSPAVGDIVGNPVAVEIWSKAIVGGKPAAGTPYWHWAFPFVRVRYDGDREFSNGALSNEFSGTGVGNESLVATGLNPQVPFPDSYITYKDALVNPFSYVRAADKPQVGWTGSFVPTTDNSIGCAGNANVANLTAADFAAVPTAAALFTAAQADPDGGILPPAPPPAMIGVTDDQLILNDEINGDPAAVVDQATLMAGGDPNAAIIAAIKTHHAGFDETTDDAYIVIPADDAAAGPAIVYFYEHSMRHIAGTGNTPDPDAATKFPFIHAAWVGDGGYVSYTP